MPLNSIDKKYWPKQDNNTIVWYLETNEINKLTYSIIESIVALANTDGGTVYIGYKIRYSTKKMPSKGGITEELSSFYKDGIDSIIKKIPEYVEGFSSDLTWTSWRWHTYSTKYYVIHVKGYEKSLLTLNWPEKKVNAVFVRENGQTIKLLPLDNDKTSTSRKRVKYKILQPVIQHPDFRNHKLINLNIPNLLNDAYKYMTLESFVLSLLNGTWQFAEPTRWNDEYEGRFYRADYSALKVPNCPPKLFATCITGEKASEAAWKVYAHGEGLGSKCVQIKIDMNKLRTDFSRGIFKRCAKGDIEVPGTIYEGTVFYDLKDQEINTLDAPVGAYYDTFFDCFNTDSFLKLLLIKRKAYEYEKETRLFIVPDDFQEIDRSVRSRKGDVMNVVVNWKDIIKEIRIDKKCSEAEMETIKYACEHAGIKLQNHKRRGPRKKEETPLILFNVDEMKGPKNITIKTK